MSDGIYADNAGLYKSYRVAQENQKINLQQLATGRALTRPGDDTVAFDQASSMDIDRSSRKAQMQALQGRLSWFQTSTAYLSNIREMLSEMSALSLRARSATSTKDRELIDATFQKFKEQIAQTVDGQSGQQGPAATFNGLPVLLDFVPDVATGIGVPEGKVLQPQLGLYTGYQRDGFDTLPLKNHPSQVAVPAHSSVAAAGTATTITLGAGAAAIDGLYNGLTITITAGTGSGQTATISDYNSETRVATLTAPLAIIPDATSEYQIDATVENETLYALPGVTKLRVASWAWGADNDRAVDDQGTFRALTETERVYRTVNAIPDTDLEAKTYEERLQRRKQNIFDSEYGNVLLEGNADRMQKQIDHAIKQITGMVTAHASRAKNIEQQLSGMQQEQEATEFGIDSFEKVDAVKTASLLSAVSIDPVRIIELASRLSDNMKKLNDLVRSKGVR